MPQTRASTKANKSLNSSYITIVERDSGDNKYTYNDAINIYRHKLAEANAEIMNMTEEMNVLKCEIKTKNKKILIAEKKLSVLDKKENDIAHYKECCTYQKLEIENLKRQISNEAEISLSEKKGQEV